MLFVPVIEYGGYGRTLAERQIGHYRLIVQNAGADINVPQLVLNVLFATLLGAICANMSKRTWRWAGGFAALAAVAVGVFILINGQVNKKSAGSLRAFAQVTPGMSKAQVESILGLPTSIENLDFMIFKKTVYRYREGKSVATVTFKDDYVESRESPSTYTDHLNSPSPAAPSFTPAVSKYGDLLSVVNPDDLKKIILFDVGPKASPLTGRDGTYSIQGFHGRLRNELSRSVEKIMLKVSIYNGAREPIEVKNLLLPDTTVASGTPVAFDRYISFNYLPKGYSYRVEIIEAHYVK